MKTAEKYTVSVQRLLVRKLLDRCSTERLIDVLQRFIALQGLIRPNVDSPVPRVGKVSELKHYGFTNIICFEGAVVGELFRKGIHCNEHNSLKLENKN